MTPTRPLFPRIVIYIAILASIVFLPKQIFAQQTIAELKDFRTVEVKGAGFTLPAKLAIHIAAVGGGDRSFWRELFGSDDTRQLYAAGWIINTETREPVWEMTYDNTSGRETRRKFDGDVTLQAGSYEVYFSAHGFEHHGNRSNVSMNIDRRKSGRSGSSTSWFSGNDNEEEFMDNAKNWGITLSTDEKNTSSIHRFDPPTSNEAGLIFRTTHLGDNDLVKKLFTLASDTHLHIYAIGEGRRHEGMFDYGWIVNRETRERVWEMTDRNSRHAGGAAKNLALNDDVMLPRGSYEVYFTTDGSHSNDDWNARPPYDPFNYGMTISANTTSDKNAATIRDLPENNEPAIVSLTKVRDNDYVSSGFTLKNDTKVHVYALGEMDSDDDMADYGWIVNAKTRERVWEMNGRHSYHAGGAKKNRMADEILTLPKGNYIAYYQTDGSHAYHRWNDDAPFDEEHWGLTVYGSGERFDPKSVTAFNEEENDGEVIARLIKVSDDKRLRESFTIAAPTKVHVYALGEGQDREMYDYGWIEDASNGHIVWEMTYNMTTRAGGARKNRLVSASLLLDKGTYELHYETDGSHSFNDWNDDPPEDRTHWGITLTREQ